MTARRWTGALALAALMAVAAAERAEARPDDQMWEDFRAGYPELFRPNAKGRVQPMAVPDIFGPGAVLTVGSVHMKITNFATLGNPFTSLSSDPSAQWPAASGKEYLSFILLSVGAVNPRATDPAAIRRVSYFSEWRPPTLNPEDRMYRSYDGFIGHVRFVDDDEDSKGKDDFDKPLWTDEEFLDGRDNDGDGHVDEDCAAIGQQMFTCVMRDDTDAALAATFNERHVPFGLECRQAAWAYSVPGFADFNAIEYTIINRSGGTLDSMYIAWRADVDAGPAGEPTYFNDDMDLPFFPNGEFTLAIDADDPRYQFPHVIGGVPQDSALCPRVKIRINGFTVADDDGDEGETPGVATFLLLGHTTDPLGLRAPRRVGFRAFRSYIAGTPYLSGGNPVIDSQRFEFMSSEENIDQETGFINALPVDDKGDIQSWCSIGPFLSVPDGGSVTATIAFAVQRGDFASISRYPADYQAYQDGALGEDDLFERYPALANAFSAQVAYEGVYERPREAYVTLVPDRHGRETPLRAEPGFIYNASDCREDGTPRQVNEFGYTWFDFDCDYCTGVWNPGAGAGGGQGYFLKRWNAEAPPPNPNLNVASGYNFSDNPSRRVAPSGDNQITLAWDNLPEITVDPKTGEFDFRAIRVWKAANWRRPIGSAGPSDEDWALLAEFRFFDYADSNKYFDPDSGRAVCPKVFVPNAPNPDTGEPGASIPICLYRGDLWDRQSGLVLRPDPTVECLKDAKGLCLEETGRALGSPQFVRRTKYPVGRYKFVDREVKNGFVYFYSVSAGDSTSVGTQAVELWGRRTAVEAEGVVPQAGTQTGRNVRVVPNPYRGYRDLGERPSAWDLTPNASDPTGTSIAFMGMPPGAWTLKIFTVAGDLVAVIRSTDPVNDSVRGMVTIPNPSFDPDKPPHPVTNPPTIQMNGANRQQDNPNDGQARWNLISRNGQDVVSGIYLFVVESNEGTQRGKFVVIR